MSTMRKKTAGLLRAAHAVAMGAWLEFREMPVGTDWWLDKVETLSQLAFELGRTADAVGFLAELVDGRVGEERMMKELPEVRALRRCVFGKFMGRRERSLREKPGRPAYVEVTL